MQSRSVVDRPDQLLVNAFLRARDEASFRELYRRHTPALYGLALRLSGGSKADSQDAIQDTWIRACKAFEHFQWKSSLRTWLTGILINRVREFNRERERQREEELPEDHSITIAAQALTTIELEQIIARLPNGYRYVLILHDIEGYTHEEIGVLMEIAPGTSKSQLSHAREALRSALRSGAKDV